MATGDLNGNEEGRVPTFIPGFDKLIGGGFVKHSLNLLSGGAGTGKTVFSLHYLYNGVVNANENALFVSFEENLPDLKKDAIAFGMDFTKFEEQKRAKFVYLSPYNLQNFKEELSTEVSIIDAKRVVIDSTSTFGLGLDSAYEVRKELYALSKNLKKLRATAIITSEITGEAPLDMSSGSGFLSRFGVEEFVADSVITLHYGGMGGSEDRAVRIVKMRRTDHAKGVIPMSITSKGIIIHTKEKAYK